MPQLVRALPKFPAKSMFASMSNQTVQVRQDKLDVFLRELVVRNYKNEESVHREWSTVVDISISITPFSFKPVLLSLPRSPLSKTPKHVIF